MSKEDDIKDQESQDEEKFMNEFARISQEGILREYEKKNRDRIVSASLIVKDAFDKRWKKVTGNSYFQPVTTIAVPHPYKFGRDERIDPKGKHYRTRVNFSRIQWQKIRRKFGKKWVDLYILHGEEAENKTFRPIFQNLAENRLREVLGDEHAQKILSLKSETNGELEGNFDISVEGYWMVIFAPQKDQNDTKDVRLLWEGQCLMIERMKEVIVPGFYLEVADNSLRDVFGEDRKKIGVIQENPYTPLREATREEFLTKKAHGDALLRDRLSKEGITVR